MAETHLRTSNSLVVCEDCLDVPKISSLRRHRRPDLVMGGEARGDARAQASPGPAGSLETLTRSFVTLQRASVKMDR